MPRRKATRPMSDTSAPTDKHDENGIPASASEIGRGPATREDYAEAIGDAYRDTLEDIFRMGDLLIEAKDDLAHGEFGQMVEDDLPFGKRTSRKLRAIARDDRLRNRTRASDLPAAWSTLHRLTKLDDRQWAAVEPHISPELTRSEIPELVAKGAQLRLKSPERRSAQKEVEAALRDLSASTRNWTKKRLLRPGVPPTTAIRVAKAMAELPKEERKKLITFETPPPDLSDADDLQMVLPGFAEDERGELLERDALEHTQMEGARSAINLQALLRWAAAFCDRTTPESILAGLWSVRSPQKVTGDARQVARWMAEMADAIEREA